MPAARDENTGLFHATAREPIPIAPQQAAHVAARNAATAPARDNVTGCSWLEDHPSRGRRARHEGKPPREKLSTWQGAVKGYATSSPDENPNFTRLRRGEGRCSSEDLILHLLALVPPAAAAQALPVRCSSRHVSTLHHDRSSRHGSIRQGVFDTSRSVSPSFTPCECAGRSRCPRKRVKPNA